MGAESAADLGLAPGEYVPRRPTFPGDPPSHLALVTGIAVPGEGPVDPGPAHAEDVPPDRLTYLERSLERFEAGIDGGESSGMMAQACRTQIDAIRARQRGNLGGTLLGGGVGQEDL